MSTETQKIPVGKIRLATGYGRDWPRCVHDLARCVNGCSTVVQRSLNESATVAQLVVLVQIGIIRVFNRAEIVTPKQKALDLIAQLTELIDSLPDLDIAPTGASARIVTAKKASEMTGYSHGQLESRRRDGTHQQGVIWWHDGKGSIVYDIEQLEDWMRGGLPARKARAGADNSHKTTSKQATRRLRLSVD